MSVKLVCGNLAAQVKSWVAERTIILLIARVLISVRIGNYEISEGLGSLPLRAPRWFAGMDGPATQMHHYTT
jgi:hypothetical protein